MYMTNNKFKNSTTQHFNGIRTRMGFIKCNSKTLSRKRLRKTKFTVNENQ